MCLCVSLVVWLLDAILVFADISNSRGQVHKYIDLLGFKLTISTIL